MQELNLIKGKIPILLTAPHVFRHPRPSLKSEWKQGEPWTDVIAETVAKETGAFCISPNQILSYDPNYFREDKNPFKKEIRRLNSKHKFKIVIDIHGLSDKHQYDFGIYYVNRFGRSKELALSLAQQLNQTELRDSIIQLLHFKDYNLQETIGEFTTKSLRIPSVQLEIARYIREDKDLRQTIISSLTNFILGRLV